MTASHQDWKSWLHDPRHWDKFYNRVGMKTYAAIGREILSGHPPSDAVERAVDGIARQMRDSALPEEVIGAYCDEYLRHRDHLMEIAQEIAATVPLHASHREREHQQSPQARAIGAGDGAAPGPASVMEPLLWLTRLQTSFTLDYLQAAAMVLRVMTHEIEIWSHLISRYPEHRHHASFFRSSNLKHHYGRRAHDVDVERL